MRFPSKLEVSMALSKLLTKAYDTPVRLRVDHKGKWCLDSITEPAYEYYGVAVLMPDSDINLIAEDLLNQVKEEYNMENL